MISCTSNLLPFILESVLSLGNISIQQEPSQSVPSQANNNKDHTTEFDVNVFVADPSFRRPIGNY